MQSVLGLQRPNDCGQKGWPDRCIDDSDVALIRQKHHCRLVATRLPARNPVAPTILSDPAYFYASRLNSCLRSKDMRHVSYQGEHKVFTDEFSGVYPGLPKKRQRDRCL